MTIKEIIDTYIKSNGVRSIDGPQLNFVLTQLAEVSEYNKIQFKIGVTSGSPLDGDTTYTNSDFEGRVVYVSATNLGGDLIEGEDFKRVNSIGGADNPTGDTIELLNGLTFDDNTNWTFEVGAKYSDANRVAQESYEMGSDVPVIGPNSIIFVNQDNSPNGDGTSSIWARQNNILKYLVTQDIPDF